MANGFAAINLRLRRVGPADAPPATLLREAADAFLSEVGATVGPLYASALMEGARLLGDETLDRRDVGKLVLTFADGIRARGRAELGDKTMIDVWYPAGDDGLDRGHLQAAISRRLRVAARQVREMTNTTIANRAAARRGAASPATSYFQDYRHGQCVDISAGQMPAPRGHCHRHLPHDRHGIRKLLAAEIPTPGLPDRRRQHGVWRRRLPRAWGDTDGGRAGRPHRKITFARICT